HPPFAVWRRGQPDSDEAVWLSEWQRLQSNCIHQGEGRCGQPDGAGQRAGDDNGRSGGGAADTPGCPKVVQNHLVTSVSDLYPAPTIYICAPPKWSIVTGLYIEGGQHAEISDHRIVHVTRGEGLARRRRVGPQEAGGEDAAKRRRQTRSDVLRVR